MNADAFFAIATLAALVCLVLVPWRETMTAWARQIIFEKRDAVFDVAASGRLDFDSQEYRRIRSSMEASIRFAHELSFTRMLFQKAAHGMIKPKQSAPVINSAVSAIEDEATRAEVARLVHESQMALVYMVVLKSPLLMLFAVFVLALARVTGGVRSMADNFTSQLGEVFQREAESVPVTVRVR